MPYAFSTQTPDILRPISPTAPRPVLHICLHQKYASFNSTNAFARPRCLWNSWTLLLPTRSQSRLGDPTIPPRLTPHQRCIRIRASAAATLLMTYMHTYTHASWDSAARKASIPTLRPTTRLARMKMQMPGTRHPDYAAGFSSAALLNKRDAST